MIIRLVFFSFFAVFSIQEDDYVRWEREFYTLDCHSQWRKPTRKMYYAIPFRENMERYADFRFTPDRGEITGTFRIDTYLSKSGESLKLQTVFPDLSYTEMESISLGLPGYKNNKILKVKDGPRTLDYYQTNWYFQGVDRFYRISFGSYDKSLYERYLGVATKMAESFTEK